MTTRVKETERKYEPVDTDGGLLAGVPGVTVVGGGEDLLLDAVYHDTADLRLARNGVTLRRRTGGEDAGWHLKLPLGDDARDEIRAKATKDAKRVPKELTDLVLGLTRGEPLAPIAHIRTKRKRWELLDDDGRIAAEVVEDDVMAQTLGETSEIKAWREIEVELVEGGGEVFDAVERTLGRPSDAPAKLLRLLGDRIPKEPKAADRITAYVRQQVAELRRQDLRVRQDAEDSVHQMRVASRRIRSILQAYKGSRSLREELRWLGGVLGEARDLEVLREHLQAEVDALPAELVLGNVRQRLTETFAPREQAARAEVLETLRSKRYFTLLDRLDTLRIRSAKARKRLRDTRRRVDRAWRNEARGNGTLHDVRKAAKRARYVAEAAGKKKLARRMKKLTKRLGLHQDSVVARQELRAIGVQSHLDGDNGFTYGLLHGRQQRRAERVEESLRRKV
ncbi:CYTH and CHAD domain-containing protein [Kutzneria kofuensis]|uniref:CHAD domain-containing protein n=1 Tax=Kutzneria kofuensis TaxID=103725 RepID=A0A7W9KCI8_9PSEU|nr:CYTH and CHAD domain-containing protein [Kutzneria kofuensis]MBB5889294.1 CHAD domain-containing protein [Kutzneria kofuensis]